MKILLHAKNAFGGVLLMNKAFGQLRVRSDVFSMAGFKEEHVKTMLVDFDRDIDGGDEFIAVAGHMHNPVTGEDRGYMYVQLTPYPWTIYHMSMPNLPFGFTAVQARGAIVRSI